MKNRNIPFGYRYEDGKIVVNPDEQNTLQRICSEYLDGRSLLQIANGLESDKVEFVPGIITWNNGKTRWKAEGQAGRHEDRARSVFQQIRTYRASDLRRMRNAISQMHLGSQWQEESGMAVHQSP